MIEMTSGKNSSWQRTSAKISLNHLKYIMFKLEHYFYWTIWKEKIQPSGDRVWWTFYKYNYEHRVKDLWTKRTRKICQGKQTSKQWFWAIFFHDTVVKLDLSVRPCPFVISRFHCISNIVSNIYCALTKKPFFFFTPYLIYVKAIRALSPPPPPWQNQRILSPRF